MKEGPTIRDHEFVKVVEQPHDERDEEPHNDAAACSCWVHDGERDPECYYHGQAGPATQEPDDEPSEKAVSAAAWMLGRTTASGRDYEGPFNIEDYMRQARRVLGAAHDPALGLDRSVCLGAVVEQPHDERAGNATQEPDEDLRARLLMAEAALRESHKIIRTLREAKR